MGHVDLASRSLTFVNHRWRQLTGIDQPTPISFALLEDCLHPEDRPRVAEAFARGVQDRREFSVDTRLVRDDGTTRSVRFECAPVVDGRGVLRSYSGVMLDITETTHTEEALRESELRFRALSDSMPLGVFRSSVDGRLQYVNQRWSEITEIPVDRAAGLGTLDLVHPDDLERITTARERQAIQQGAFRQQFRIVTATGQVRWVSVHASSAIDETTGQLTGFIGSMEDITPLVTAQEETARLAGIVESTSDMVGVADADTGQMQYLNRAARELLGYGDADIAGLRALDLYVPEAQEIWQVVVEPALLRGGTWSGELPMQATDGSTVQVWQTIAAKRRPDGRMTQISAVGRDVTERRRFEAALAHQATHDALTDLPNRALLLDHLGLALARASRDGKLVALLFLDLDRFKSINDTFGHEVGDELLVAVARRINEVLRPADTVARLGGDEFVILCEDVADEHHAVAIAQRVLSLIEASPFELQGSEVDMTASVGIALSPGGEDAHPEALLRDADAAMYRAKDLGRARLELFDESMRRRAAQRLELADELAGGIEHGEIVVHYQPCVSLVDGRVIAVEALARWHHPERGLLAPQEFIALAEETGLIVGLGLRVLSDACAQGRRWMDTLGDDAPRVHVNLSARQLTAANLAVLVRTVLEASGLEPDRLCLEITESVLMEDAPAVIEALRRLKHIGVTLAIDDFGTGYSSLSYLRRFPVDVLKVDQSFIDGLGPDPEDSAIVAAIVNLADTLELEAIAEGVETREQLARLRELGCAAAQGFLFSHPKPAHDITPVLATAFDL
jgi:diguanylate cyclase (GGDEF)-like protein/PAS domain S-box-containing protein